MRFVVTTPHVLRALQARERELPFRERIKPFNFVMSPLSDPRTLPVEAVDGQGFTLIAPFTEDSSSWYDLPYVNVHDGRTYRLAPHGKRLPSEAQAQTYGEIVSRYVHHAEAKSLAPDGKGCRAETRGLLQRTPVTAGQFHRIGKETDRRWEQGEDFRLLMPTLVQYQPDETERLASNPGLADELRRWSIRAIARESGISPTTIKAARRGHRIRKSTAHRLRTVIKNLI